MIMYRVRWEIDIEASSPFEAACFASQIQNNPDSTANVFEVIEHQYLPLAGSWTHSEMIDLDE